MMPIFSVEGNISAGKSTLLQLLGELSSEYFIVPEPITQWTNFHGDNVLQKFYEDPYSNAFLFQSLVELTFLKASLTLPQEKPIIFERSFEASVKVFMELAFQNKYVKSVEKNMMEERYDLLKTKFNIEPTHFIYLRVGAERCFGRMRKRNRDEENEVTLEYLLKIQTLLDDWLLKKKNVTIIDGNRSPKEILNDVVSVIKKLLQENRNDA